MNTTNIDILRDPFVMLMVCGKAEFNEPDVKRLLTDMDYAKDEREKRLAELYKPETGEELGNPDAWKFLLLMADEKWRKDNPLQGDIIELPYRLGALVTNDAHLKAIMGDGEELTDFQTTLRAATKLFEGFRNEGII
ncbi:hypothetical protein MLDJOKPK_00191 [Salmonella phage SPAsTU]|nr:hypothetical protein MLDJOKPK_00191 [Salmonella phage SPAsTU]